jgi:hypothetical protein
MMGWRPDRWARIIHKRTAMFAKGYERGSKDTSEHLREMIIYNLLNDAVLSTCMGTETMEKIVQIVEES